MRFLKYHAPALAWCCTIFIASSIPGANLPEVIIGRDKLVHFGVYFALGWLFFRAFEHSRVADTGVKNVILVTITLGALFAASDELHQHFVPGRSMEIYDFMADVMGIATAVFLKSKYFLSIDRI